MSSEIVSRRNDILWISNSYLFPFLSYFTGAKVIRLSAHFVIRVLSINGTKLNRYQTKNFLNKIWIYQELKEKKNFFKMISFLIVSTRVTEINQIWYIFWSMVQVFVAGDR